MSSRGGPPGWSRAGHAVCLRSRRASCNDGGRIQPVQIYIVKVIDFFAVDLNGLLEYDFSIHEDDLHDSDVIFCRISDGCLFHGVRRYANGRDDNGGAGFGEERRLEWIKSSRRDEAETDGWDAWHGF